jgi:hypothetical protein
MKYMLLCYVDERVLNDLGEPEQRQAVGEAGQLVERLMGNGKCAASSRLHPVSTARSVRVRDGKALVTDGPFAETREQLGGFYLIDAEDIDEAIAIAAQNPGARYGTTEVRPLLEITGLPTG